ncbi:DUF418 domain-containing protein [Streptomyces tibetensis]|uniref:DUF418 domain-containing protein n=1 Tax=Streptomyces tibetensis TaxID=2382123 RepID=UPI003F4CE51A
MTWKFRVRTEKGGTGCTRLYILLGFTASVALLATIWSRFFQRGPLEWLMGRATGVARRIQ